MAVVLSPLEKMVLSPLEKLEVSKLDLSSVIHECAPVHIHAQREEDLTAKWT